MLSEGRGPRLAHVGVRESGRGAEIVSDAACYSDELVEHPLPPGGEVAEIVVHTGDLRLTEGRSHRRSYHVGIASAQNRERAA